MNASTGDILLFRGDPSSKLDKLIMDVTHSVYSHAALCIKDPWWGDLPAGTYIIQSERARNDCEINNFFFFPYENKFAERLFFYLLLQRNV